MSKKLTKPLAADQAMLAEIAKLKAENAKLASQAPAIGAKAVAAPTAAKPSGIFKPSAMPSTKPLANGHAKPKAAATKQAATKPLANGKSKPITISAVAIAVELGYSDKTCRAYLRRHEAALPFKPLANMPSRWHWDIKHKAAITAFLRDGAFA